MDRLTTYKPSQIMQLAEMPSTFQHLPGPVPTISNVRMPGDPTIDPTGAGALDTEGTKSKKLKPLPSTYNAAGARFLSTGNVHIPGAAPSTFNPAPMSMPSTYRG